MNKLLLLALFALILNQKNGFSQTKSPNEFLGYELGEHFTNHFQVINYFKHVAQQNSNVQFEQYGETYENRPLYYTIITSEENFTKLENIRTNHLKQTGLVPGKPDDDRIAIVWLSYNVHGNESVSTEASMKTLYSLVDPTNKENKEWLKNTIVIIDPCLNPDGRERYVNWYNQKKNTPYNSNPDAIEHHEPWPGGRPNHYLFDLNRDWAWATQIETQSRLVAYSKWMPHIHVDFHEQGVNDPYYFAPAAEPYHDVVSDFQREFQVTIGKNNAKYFDKNGWLYFTKERFDLLYPSYGDTYPMFNGAIGMTYEQGGSGRAGLGILTEEKELLTLKDRIAHHYASGMSTIEISSQNADKLTNEFQKYYKNSTEKPLGEYKAYVIKASNGEDKINNLISLLNKHQIAYGTVESALKSKGLSYATNKTEKLDIETNDLVISSFQAKSNLIKALFEPHTTLKDSLTYDITAWSLPYARGLETYAITTKIVTQPYKVSTNEGSVNSVENAYAYISKWNSTKDVTFLAYLLQNKVKVRYTKEKFTIEGKSFDAGSLIITKSGNQKLKDFHNIISEGSKKFQRQITAVQTGMVTSGYDFGSSNIAFIKAPKIAVLTGKETSSLGFGAIWHFFEQQIHYPVTVIGTEYFEDIDLHDYTVLIFPSGYYRQLLDKNQLERLNDWVKNGGKIIAINNAVAAFADSEIFEISNYEDEEVKEALKKEKDSIKKQARLEQYGDQERNYISNLITGSIFKTTLDTTNPLGYGYKGDYYTLKVSDDRYAYLESGNNVGVIKDKTNLISGFAGKNAIKTVDQSLVFGVENKGKGSVVYLVDDPLFRSFWENGKLLFSNAVFIVGN